MATQNRTEAVDMRRAYAQYGSAAPKRQPQRAPGQRPQRTVKPEVKTKSRAQILAEERRAKRKAVKVMAICAVLFLLVGFQIYSQVQLDVLDRQLNTINSQIEVAESRNTQLNMELDSIISLDKVDDYAQNVLGMVKVENYQITYIDLSGDDVVTQSGGKTQSSLIQKVKSVF